MENGKKGGNPCAPTQAHGSGSPQVIKDLYAGFPERMGNKLATRRRVANDIPVEKQLTDETDAEVDFLQKAGLDHSQIQKRLPTTKDPVRFLS